MPPGKGQWVSMRDHFPRALTPECEHILCTAMPEGAAVPFAAYGLPVATLEARTVHGHVYVAPRPLLGGHRDVLPSRRILWLAARLVPAFRRRAKAARSALATRPWLAEAAAWYLTERDEWIEAAAALRAEDPHSLDPTRLAGHLQRARGLALSGYRRHFELHGPDLVPTGLLLVWCTDRGIPTEHVLPVLRGSTPASLGRGPALERLREKVAASRTEPADLEEIREVAREELEALFAEQGWLLVTGYDLDAWTLGELPDLVVNLARPAPPAPDVDTDAALSALRRWVPVEDHAELDQLVADVRATFGVRDDNGTVTAALPMGLLRRAMLAAGRTLAERNSLQRREHVFELTVDELVGLLLAAGGPSSEVARRRAEERAARSALAPPPTLGPELDLPLDALPPAIKTMARVQLALRDTFTAPVEDRRDLHGDGIGTTVVRGRACVAADPADALARLRTGDVLVAMGTTPAYNLALSLAGAVVVEEGGLLSHAAVIARELGVSAVIGAGGAMRAIPDGALVEVDPREGSVRVLGTVP